MKQINYLQLNLEEIKVKKRYNIDEKILELREEMRKLEMKKLPISTIRRDTHYPEIDGGKTKRKRRRKSNKYKRR